MNTLEAIGFSILFLIAMLLLGGFIGLLPNMAANAILALLIATSLVLLLKWIRKPKKESGNGGHGG